MDRIAILGASGTIGGALARRLVKRGRNVLLIGRNAAKLEPLASELNQPFAEVDLSSSQHLEDVLIRETASNGDLAGLVNCVGSVLLKPAHKTTDEEFHRVIETNLFTAFETCEPGPNYSEIAAGRLCCWHRPLRRSEFKITRQLPLPRRASSAWLAPLRPPTLVTTSASTWSALDSYERI